MRLSWSLCRYSLFLAPWGNNLSSTWHFPHPERVSATRAARARARIRGRERLGCSARSANTPRRLQNVVRAEPGNRRRANPKWRTGSSRYFCFSKNTVKCVAHYYMHYYVMVGGAPRRSIPQSIKQPRQRQQAKNRSNCTLNPYI